MAKQIPSKRKYDSSRRKEQARQTRLQITETARTLFIERGYAGATIEAIAAQTPLRTNTDNFTGAGRIPESRSASSFVPAAIR